MLQCFLLFFKFFFKERKNNGQFNICFNSIVIKIQYLKINFYRKFVTSVFIILNYIKVFFSFFFFFIILLYLRKSYHEKKLFLRSLVQTLQRYCLTKIRIYYLNLHMTCTMTAKSPLLQCRGRMYSCIVGSSTFFVHKSLLLSTSNLT